MRRFERGLVLVNPTKNQSFYWLCPEHYRDLDGRPVSPGPMAIEPRKGFVLLKRDLPNLVISMSSQPGTPEPGQLLTFTVNYENQGTARAVEAVVSAIVPAWCEFHSASWGGVFDFVPQSASPDGRPVQAMGTVRWNVGTVEPGKKGVLWFKAKVR